MIICDQCGAVGGYHYGGCAYTQVRLYPTTTTNHPPHTNRNTIMSEKVDHYAEAKKIASPIQDGPFGVRIEFIQEALLHATLASIEEQRTANLIAAFTHLRDGEGVTLLEDATPLIEQIKQRLSL